MAALSQRAHRLFAVSDPEDAGAVRRAIPRMATEQALDASLLAQAELVATELATNLVRHANPGGCILARTLATTRGTGIEVVSVDQGPGIADLDAALHGSSDMEHHDGLGCGLAAVRRLATDFDVYTHPGAGTAVMARLLPDGAAVAQRWSGVSVALDHGDECGDAWAIAEEGGQITAIVVDGLGHGAKAAEAAHAAITTFQADRNEELEPLAHHVHAAMRSTRGGAVSLCRLDPRQGRAEFVGVGNVSGRLVADGSSQAMVSLSGTLGMELTPPRIRRLTYELDDGAALVMSSDGVRDGFDLGAHPGLLEHDPLVIAAVIHAERRRGNDDATVVVVRPAKQLVEVMPR
jgi:anti-sigma regulatory factor (Ser/Thr protein kinase)